MSVCVCASIDCMPIECVRVSPRPHFPRPPPHSLPCLLYFVALFSFCACLVPQFGIPRSFTHFTFQTASHFRTQQQQQQQLKTGATFGTGITAIKLTALGRPQLLVSVITFLSTCPLYIHIYVCHPILIYNPFHHSCNYPRSSCAHASTWRHLSAGRAMC